MKIARLFPALALLLPLFLAGCEGAPGLSGLKGLMGPKFKPLNSEVAAMAAPEPATTGNSLYCRVGRGSAKFTKQWLAFPDADFRLTPQSRINVPLRAVKGDGATNFQAMFDLEGQRMIFCPVKDGPPDERISCASIYALEDDLKDGIKRTFDIPDAVAGSSITCAYDKAKLQKL